MWKAFPHPERKIQKLFRVVYTIDAHEKLKDYEIKIGLIRGDE